MMFLKGDCHFLCLSALRTRQSFALAEPIWLNYKIDFIDNLHECGISDLVQAASAIGKRQSCVIVIGYNPGLITTLSWCLADAEFTAGCYNTYAD